MTNNDFDAAVQALGALAFEPERADEFADCYQKTLEGIATSMLRGEIPLETYTQRLQTLRAILVEEIKSLGGEPPILLSSDNRCHT